MCKGAPLGSQGLVLRGLEQQALQTGISLHRGPVENHGVPFTGISERELKGRVLETEHPSLWALCEGTWKGGSFMRDG